MRNWYRAKNQCRRPPTLIFPFVSCIDKETDQEDRRDARSEARAGI